MTNYIDIEELALVGGSGGVPGLITIVAIVVVSILLIVGTAVAYIVREKNS